MLMAQLMETRELEVSGRINGDREKRAEFNQEKKSREKVALGSTSHEPRGT
jgi:hypothetical protein